MWITVSIDGQRYQAFLNEALEIGINQLFDGTGPRLFGGSGPTRAPYSTGDFVGSIHKGGSCNVDTLQLTPHLDGTHTETVAHIRNDAPSIGDAEIAPLIPAVLITTGTTVARETNESLPATCLSGDQVITRGELESSLASVAPLSDAFCQATVIRTVPNDADKTTRDYDKRLPAYFSVEAILHLVDLGVQHLLVDLPSVDRTDDGGALACHQAFFGAATDGPAVRTITELIYVPDSVRDGAYLLNLQYPRLGTDAAPSRPVLIPLRPA